MNNRFVGIDVAGAQKGFHAAVLMHPRPEVVALYASRDPGELADRMAAHHPRPRAIAIDCPPRALREFEATRLAERQLHRMGYRVQWTRRNCEYEALEWMENGHRLWEVLAHRFPDALLFETFPTAASDRLSGCDVVLPLNLLTGKGNRASYKDFLDASICAWVAREAAAGRARKVGMDDLTGEVDELGPIYY